MFTCPFDQKQYDHDRIITHLTLKHPDQRHGVCPICVVRGGDPGKKSQDLMGHITLRHKPDPYYCPTEDLYNKFLEKKFKEAENKFK